MPVKLPEAITIAAIAGVAGLVSALVTAAYTYTSRSRELDIKFVEIGISILRADPKETQTKGAREWAIAIIESYSGRPFSAEARRELLGNQLGFTADWGLWVGTHRDGTIGECTRTNPCVNFPSPQSK